jgi:Ca2+-binding EF-hand superfamily protein
MIAALDKDGSGTIDWLEFAEMMMARRGKVNVDDEIQQVFAMFDKDQTKGITKEGI